MTNLHYFTITFLTLSSLAGCGGGGGGSSTPTFGISSATYSNDGIIPVASACTIQMGSNISPQITLSNLPANTNKIALIMDDEVSPCGTGTNACVHWAVFNLPVSKTQISAGENLLADNNVKFGTSYDSNATGYKGPCPPSNHTYKLTAYALKDSMPTISTVLSQANSTRAGFEANHLSHIIDKVTLTGRYPQ